MTLSHHGYIKLLCLGFNYNHGPLDSVILSVDNLLPTYPWSIIYQLRIQLECEPGDPRCLSGSLVPGLGVYTLNFTCMNSQPSLECNQVTGRLTLHSVISSESRLELDREIGYVLFRLVLGENPRTWEEGDSYFYFLLEGSFL